MTENEKLRALLAEAQAEVERLRGVDCGVTERDGTTTPLCGVCLECAFLRGAEAMREAAAGAAVERARYWTEASAAEGGITSMEDRAEEAQLTADDIRDLPVPEDDR